MTTNNSLPPATLKRVCESIHQIPNSKHREEPDRQKQAPSDDITMSSVSDMYRMMTSEVRREDVPFGRL